MFGDVIKGRIRDIEGGGISESFYFRDIWNYCTNVDMGFGKGYVKSK